MRRYEGLQLEGHELLGCVIQYLGTETLALVETTGTSCACCTSRREVLYRDTKGDAYHAIKWHLLKTK